MKTLSMSQALHVDVDNEKLKRALKIKQEYEAGEWSLSDANLRMRLEVKSLKPYEIAYIEQTMEAEDPTRCQKEDIQEMLMLYNGVLDRSMPNLPEDHPLKHYYDENARMRELLDRVKALKEETFIHNVWLGLYDEIAQWKIHLHRKQNQLYPALEQRGFDRPSKFMWLLDNYVRDEINDFRDLLLKGEYDAFMSKQDTLVNDVLDLMEKEENSLLPTSMMLLRAEDFEVMKHGDAEIGFAWGLGTKPKEALKPLPDLNPNEKLEVATGWLSLKQINLIFKHMPVDISYVDEHDIMSFYTDTEHRVFPRSRNVIGRLVQNCHPSSSVDKVQEIIDKFRSGEESTVDFWLNKPDFFVYIKYVAVRDENGVFRGVLEMMQDCTRIRALQGERKLLDWSASTKADGSKEEVAAPVAQEEESNELDLSASEPAKDPSSWTAETRMLDVIAAYPQLRQRMVEISVKYAMLRTPLARVMLPKATLGMIAERGGFTAEELIAKMKALI